MILPETFRLENVEMCYFGKISTWDKHKIEKPNWKQYKYKHVEEKLDIWTFKQVSLRYVI